MARNEETKTVYHSPRHASQNSEPTGVICVCYGKTTEVNVRTSRIVPSLKIMNSVNSASVVF